MINKAFLIGRLTTNPDMKTIQGNSSVTTFTLAVDRTFKNKDGTKDADFIPVVCWNKTAELCNQYLSKGSLCAVSGRIQVRSYEANDGSKRYVTEIVSDEVQFLSTKGDNKSNVNMTPSQDSFDEFSEIDDSDVPF